MRRVIFWTITLAVIFAACFSLNANPVPGEYAALVPPANVLNAPEAIAAGRALFLTNCTPCHGISGDGKGTTNPTFGPKPVNFTDHARMPTLSPKYLFWRVSEGGRTEPFRSQGSIMPAWKYQLTEPQRWQVIAYIQTLSR